ncbi:MAG: hypothetical protein Q4B60_00345 [Erysipelotrichaceae bacterium]|nr:hypothetical protein [Erysipelotrichaceae bacterium]
MFKRRFEMVLTISMILGTLLLFFFGFLGHISYGYYFSWVFVTLFYLIVLYWLIKRDYQKLRELKDNLFTFGTLAFAILCVFIFVLYRYQGFSNCDEFTHWGPMLKETLRLDGFYTQEASKLIMHKDYPPFFTLVEMLWLGFGGFVYHEGYAYVALVAFMFSMFMPVYHGLKFNKKEDWLKALLITLSILLVGLTIDKTITASDYAFVYNSIYVDWALALFCSYALYVTYKESDWGFYQLSFLSLVLITFILMKQMGLVYYIVVLFFAFLKVLLIDKKLDVKMLIKGVVLLIVIPLCFYVLWKKYVNIYEIDRQFEIGELSLKTFVNIITGNTEIGWKYQAFRNYCSALIKRPLILHPFKMTYFVYVLLVDLIILLINRFKKESIYISGVYTIGAIGYSVAMLLLYTLAFTVDEAPYLASFDRYMVSYLYAGTTIVTMLAIDKYSNSTLKETMVLLAILLFVEPETLEHLIPKPYDENQPTLKILVVEQYNDGIDFGREKVNGFNLEFDRIGYVEESEENFELFKSKLMEDDDLYIIGYDDTIYHFWQRLGVEDYLFNEAFYDLNKTNGLSVKWDAYSFIHYVIMYYQLGI